jgi:hypothetical protein
MLTGRPDVEGVCVFCHYGIKDWDSNGQLVTKKEATYVDIEFSRWMDDYDTAVVEAVDYYWKAIDRGCKYNQDLSFLRGTTIFRYMNREFDYKDYKRMIGGN